MTDKASKHEYRFIDKDPILDLIKTEAQIDLAGHVGARITKAQFEKWSLDCGIGVATLREWLYGGTKKPRALSTRFALAALGVRTVRYRRDGTKIETNW